MNRSHLIRLLVHRTQAALDLARLLALWRPPRFFPEHGSSLLAIVASDQGGQREALGSGFIVSRGRIVANHHVVEGMNEAFVVFSDGMVKPVSTVVADSVQQDLIILTVETGNRSALVLGDELSMQQGHPVYALGAGHPARGAHRSAPAAII